MGAFFGEGKSVEADATHKFLSKQLQFTAAIKDIILVTKDGQLDYMDSIWTSDTSGIVVSMIPNAGNVTDIDGNVYQSVKIGNQVWTVQNLRVTKYNDGSNIVLDTNATTWWGKDTDIIGKYCFYNNSTDTAYQHKWGALYNWYVVNTGKLAPSGWHVPTKSDWTTLSDYLGGDNLAGGKLKETCTLHWLSPNTGAINTSGFSALGGGFRLIDCFSHQNSEGYWWSSTEYDLSFAWSRGLAYNKNEMIIGIDYRKDGYSVRLVRN